MLKIAPIPLNLLTAEILFYKRLDTERENEFEEPVLIKNCRVVFGKQRNMQEWGEEDKYNLNIYLDYVNSKPFLIPNNGDKIKYSNLEYIINSVDIHRPFAEIHHIKVVAS